MSDPYVLARLIGGPHDGRTEAMPARATPPELVTIAWCCRCHREHLHSVDDPDIADEQLPKYLRDWRALGTGTLLYRYLDVDADLDDLHAELATNQLAELLDAPPAIGARAVTPR